MNMYRVLSGILMLLILMTGYQSHAQAKVGIRAGVMSSKQEVQNGDTTEDTLKYHCL